MRKRSEVAPPEAPGEETKIEEASKPLRDVLKEAENVEDPSFDSLPRAKPMHAGFDRVVSKVFIEDVEKTYDELEAGLRSGEKRTEHAFLKKALDEAARNYYDAHRLMVTSKQLYEGWCADNALVTATMRERAYRALQHEKEQGLRNKTISDADVDSRAALLFPVEWVSYAKSKRTYELTTRNLEALVEAWNHRVNALKAMVTS